MNFVHSNLIGRMFSRGSQFGGIFLLAMCLGGPGVRHEFYQMTADLTHVSSKIEFADWVIRSQYRMIELVQIDWKPISVFPEEAKRIKR